MKKLIILFIITLSGGINVSSQDIPFIFDKKRIDVGVLYGYEYSRNKEDFELSKKAYFYVKNLNDIEIIWVHIKNDKKASSFSFDKYKMNWNYMMFEAGEFIDLRNDNEIPIGGSKKGSINIDFFNNTMLTSETIRTKNGLEESKYVVKIKSFPTYYYQIDDLMSLWFALRFYPFDKEKITVNHGSGGYNIEFDIKYIGKEEVEVPYGKKLCHKFELIPQMNLFLRIIFSPKMAYIWLASDDDTRYMVKYINNNNRSSFTQSMEYRLAEVKKMSLEEWEEFKDKYGARIKE